MKKLHEDACLLAAGAVLFAAMTELRSASDGDTRFLMTMSAASAAYVAALVTLLRAPRVSRWTLAICLLLAVGWRGMFVVVPTGRNSDLHRYLWDARLQRAGLNPYRVIPSDPAVAHLHTPITRTMNNMNVASPYPPAAQWFFRAVTAVDESVIAMKAALVGCDVLTAGVLLAALGPARAPWVLAYAWHPLMTLEIARNGHSDAFGVLLLVTAMVALTRGRGLIAVAAFVMAVAAKVLPIVLWPLFWRRVGLAHAAFGLLLILALYAPFVADGPTTGSFVTIVQRVRFNGPVFASLEPVLGSWSMAVIAAGAGMAAASWMRWRLPADAAAGWGWPLAISLLLSPLVYPWYLVWLIPFVTARATIPLLAWTLSVIPVYRVWFLFKLGGEWAVPAWLLGIEYGAMALAAASLFARRAGPARAPREAGATVR